MRVRSHARIFFKRKRKKKTLMPSAARAFGYVPFLFSFSCWFPAPPPPCLSLLFFCFCCSLPPASRASESWSPLFFLRLARSRACCLYFLSLPPGLPAGHFARCARPSSCLSLLCSHPPRALLDMPPCPGAGAALAPPRAPPASGRVAVVLVSLRGAPVAVPLLPPSPPVPASCPGAGAA